MLRSVRSHMFLAFICIDRFKFDARSPGEHDVVDIEWLSKSTLYQSTRAKFIQLH